MNIIETQSLTKSYADFTAVSGINFHVRKGSVYGFLGPNGAGKSTTMKMLLGLSRPTSGSAIAIQRKSRKPPYYQSSLKIPPDRSPLHIR